jgi:predicted CoA-binding protein
MDELEAKIEKFLAARAFAVVGASDKTDKYGYKCYLCYLQNGKTAYPINPRLITILGNRVYADLKSLPERTDSISVITPPAVTLTVIDGAIAAGVKNIWLQPGAESTAAVEKAEKAGLNVIYGGPCLLVTLGYHEG